MHTNSKLLSSIVLLLTIAISPITSAAISPTASDVPNAPIKTATDTYNINYPTQVNQLLSTLQPQLMMQNLSVLTKFPDRASYNKTGLQAEKWIIYQINQLLAQYKPSNATLYVIPTKGHDTWGDFDEPQDSIILRIDNSSGTNTNPAVIVGAHFDTVGCTDNGCKTDPNPDSPYPGANDNGSGTVAIIELARALLANNSNMHFKNPIYLIWYAAEELGDYGSIAVVANFQQNHIPVKAVLTLDAIGFAYNNEPTMYIQTGNGSNYDLALYQQQLIQYYVKQPTVMLPPDCHGDSDDWIWSNAGYVSGRPIEDNECDLDQTYWKIEHTNKDTIDEISLDHLTDFLKLATAFTVELAEPVSSLDKRQ